MLKIATKQGVDLVPESDAGEWIQEIHRRVIDVVPQLAPLERVLTKFIVFADPRGIESQCDIEELEELRVKLTEFTNLCIRREVLAREIMAKMGVREIGGG